MRNNLFREKSIQRMTSPEQLDDCIRTVNPGVWTVLCAVCLFLVSVLVWSVTGTLDIAVEARGYSNGVSVYVFLDEAEAFAIEEHMEAYIGEESGRVASIGEVPESYEAMAKILGGEGMAHALMIEEEDWKWRVTICGIGVKEGVCDVRIITEQRNPISYLLQ